MQLLHPLRREGGREDVFLLGHRAQDLEGLLVLQLHGEAAVEQDVALVDVLSVVRVQS